jgi:hypothetical protein
MKVNINKIKRYQAGGYMIYQPLPLQPPMATAGAVTSSSSSESQEAVEGVLDDKTIQKLLGQGLTNDVMQFSTGIENAYRQYSNMTEVERNSVYGRQLRNLMKGDLGQINALMRHKESFTNAITNVEKNNALSDLAITNQGIIVKDLTTGKIGEVSHSEYASKYRNSNKFQALTNAQLIEEREYNPHLTMDQNAYSVLNNGIGMTKVKEEVTAILSNIGSEKKSTNNTSYLLNAEGLSPELRAAAQQLVGMGPEGFYKVNTERSQETNERLLLAARDIMWNNLSSQSKSLLKAKAAVEGAGAGELEEVAKQYATSLLGVGYKNTTSEKTDVTYDDKMSEDFGYKKASGSDALSGNLGFWSLLAAKGGDMQPVQIDYGDGNVITAQGFSPGVFLSNGKPTGSTSVRNIPELKALIDVNSVSIGGAKIPQHKLEAIIYEGKEVTRVRLPAIKDGSGGVVPDLDKAKDYNELIQKLKDVPTASAREQLINSYGFYSDGKGNINPQFEADFIVFDGMVNETAMGGISDKRMIQEAEASEKESYESLYRYNNSTGDDDKEIAGTGTDYGMFNWLFPNKVYKGRIFMALRGDQLHTAGRTASGDQLSVAKSMLTPEHLGQRK